MGVWAELVTDGWRVKESVSLLLLLHEKARNEGNLRNLLKLREDGPSAQISAGCKEKNYNDAIKSLFSDLTEVETLLCKKTCLKLLNSEKLTIFSLLVFLKGNFQDLWMNSKFINVFKIPFMVSTLFIQSYSLISGLCVSFCLQEASH